MNSYFFKMTNDEKNSILDQHKTIYDGFATQYSQPKEQPLYVQDFANDKGGLTVNNKGDIKNYTNININEVYADSGFVPEETFEYVSLGEIQDKIGDGPEDLNYGTFEDDETELLVSPDGEFELFIDDEDIDPEFNDVSNLEIDNEYDNVENLQEQINKSLDMFRRFKKY